LKNSQEQRLRLPLQSLKNANADFQETLKTYAGDEYIFYVVSALTTADNFSITLGNLDSLANTSTIGNIADFNLSINNQCNANVDITGGAPFFKPSFFDIVDGTIKPAKAVPLKKVSMVVSMKRE